MVALRKQHKLFVAAYNKPRHSTRSARAEAPAGVPPLLREDEPSPRLLPRPSGHFQPWSDVGWGILGGQYNVPAGCYVATAGPSQGRATLFDHLSPQQIKLSVPFDPRLLHKNSMQFYGALWLPCPAIFFLLLQLSCSQPQGQNKTSQGVVNVLIMQRPGDGSMHTLKHGSLWQTMMLLLLIFPQMEHIKRRAEPFALWS